VHGEPPGDAALLVDDIVTKGSTLVGAASRLQEAFPGLGVRGFALVRTRGLIEEVEALVEPCVGTIRFDGQSCARTP